MTLLSVRQLSRSEGRQVRVSQVDFRFNRGEILGLLGSNGAGKSTTLSMISGALMPSTGQVLILGQDLYSGPASIKRQIGLLAEQPCLYPELTVNENLDFSAGLRGLDRQQGRIAKRRVVDLCGLGSVEDRLVNRLSRGFLQRAGIAQAMIHQPDLLILDEPTLGLDPIQAQQLRDLLKAISVDCGILLSTHLLIDIEQLCSRAVILHQGRQVAETDLHTPGTSDVLVQFSEQMDETRELRIMEIPGIESIEHQADGTLRLFLGQDSPPNLVERLAGLGFGLKKYEPVQDSIAKLFHDITHEDAGGSGS